MSEGVSEERDLYGFNCSVPCPPPLRHQRSTSMRFEDPDSPPMYRSLAQGSSSAMLDDGYDDVPVYRSISGLACLEVATHAVSDHALEEDVSCRGYAGCGHAGSWGQLGASSSADYPEAHAYRGLSALLSSTHVEACAPTLPPPGFVFELPAELLDEVLSLLAPCPGAYAQRAPETSPHPPSHPHQPPTTHNPPTPPPHHPHPHARAHAYLHVHAPLTLRPHALPRPTPSCRSLCGDALQPLVVRGGPCQLPPPSQDRAAHAGRAAARRGLRVARRHDRRRSRLPPKLTRTSRGLGPS